MCAGSKAAHLGLRKGKALLSVWSSLSPQASTKEALTTFKSWGSSAATNFSKKYAGHFTSKLLTFQLTFHGNFNLCLLIYSA